MVSCASGGRPLTFGRRHSRALGYKLTPGHNALDEFKQFHLARAPGAPVQIKGLLVHSRIVAPTVGVTHVPQKILNTFPRHISENESITQIYISPEYY
jgi:hypothetical protein